MTDPEIRGYVFLHLISLRKNDILIQSCFPKLRTDIMRSCKIVVFAILILLIWVVTSVQADGGDSNNPDNPDSGAFGDMAYDNAGLDDEFDEGSVPQVYDPLSGYNRFMTTVNDKLYFWVLKPVARGFEFVIPEPGRLAISRCFKNILFPVRLVNNLLQLKIKRAGIESARFGVNTTIGILGFGDPARSWLDLNACDEDFGQTLGAYGVGSGFYLVLPIFGPSNARDTLGMFPDYFLNPINYIDSYALQAGVQSFGKFNYTSLHLGEYEGLKKDAIDFYSFMRDAYEQNRKMKIEE